MKILVAGGAGYVGSKVVPALLEHGYDVEVMDLLWFGNHLPPSVPVTRQDVFNCTPKDLEKFEQVIFLAGLSNDPMAEFSPAMNFVQNAAAPGYLAFISKQAGVKRMIYASSCSVYGYTGNTLYDEEAPVTCQYPYGISKLLGERAALQQQDDKFSVVALRQGTICGYSPRMRFDLIVNAMFKTAMSDGVVIVDNPSIWRPIFDIRDAVSAYLRAVQASYDLSGVFNVASGNYTVGQVADHVKEEVEARTGRAIRFDIRNKQDFRNYKVSIERAQVQLGFAPQYAVRDIVADLFGHTDEYASYDSDEYYNVRVFKKLALSSHTPQAVPS
jgi:nucleoside-diphosphate-sugar epimerase